jgi:hypothetical protein
MGVYFSKIVFAGLLKVVTERILKLISIIEAIRTVVLDKVLAKNQ